jgi:hypothetical protein
MAKKFITGDYSSLFLARKLIMNQQKIYRMRIINNRIILVEINSGFRELCMQARNQFG